MDILHIFQYSFIQKAILAGIFISLPCSLLGLFLVLRKMSMIGDGLAHLSFGAVALGLFLGMYPMAVALPIVILGSFFVLKITESNKVYGDAAIGIVSAAGIAGGVLLSSMARGFNVDLFAYLFGNILAISSGEVWLSAILSLAVLAGVWLFYRDLFSITFDEEYARASGVKAKVVNTFFVILVALTVVLAIKIVGTMLVSALLVLPAASSLQVAGSFKKAILASSVFSIICICIGIALSFYSDLPAGATIVALNFILFLGSFAWKRISA
jgi:zinc transport system permease protein